jgi:protein tyrosine phosphatase (PTP) superfamily phosphohydrolase (DUF442 family)
MLVAEAMGAKRLFILAASALFISVVIVATIALVRNSQAKHLRVTPTRTDTASTQPVLEPLVGVPRSEGPGAVEGTPAGKIDENSGEVKAALPLFHRVDLDYLRGGLPARDGPDLLARLGVKTLVDLRSTYDRTPGIPAEAERLGLGYYWLPLSVWDPPTDAQTAEFLAVVTDKSRSPVFVFCTDGLNRTGEMTAIYRMAHDRCTVEEAIQEMDDAGFSPYYYSLRNYVWAYARSHGLRRIETSRK